MDIIWNGLTTIEDLKRRLTECEKYGFNAVEIKSEIYGQGEQDEITYVWLSVEKLDESQLKELEAKEAAD